MGKPKVCLDRIQDLLEEGLSRTLGKTRDSLLPRIVLLGCVSCRGRGLIEVSSPTIAARPSYWCGGSSPTLYAGPADRDTFSMDQRSSKSDMPMHVDNSSLSAVILTVATGTWRAFRNSNSFQPARLGLLEEGHRRA